MKKSALKLTIFLALCFINFFSVSTVRAHPLDEIDGVKVYDQKQTLIITPYETIFRIDLKFYAIEKIKLWESIDQNRDKELSQQEKDTWMKKGQNSSWLDVDGIQYSFKAQSLVFPDYYVFFSRPPADVIIEFVSKVSVKPPQEINYHYEGKDRKLEEIDLIAEGKNGIAVKTLKKVDAETAKISLDESIFGFSSQILGTQTNNKINRFLDTFVKVDSLSLPLVLTAFATAFILGVLHTLTPGHGKALVAGYLVGERGRIINALQLGGIITITHTASVFLLGLVALILTQYILPVTVIRWLNTLSGFLITSLGILLLVTRIRKLRQRQKEEMNHHHDQHHDHIGDHELNFKSILPLGISGGIAPCIDALAILVVAISLGKIVMGLLLLFVFSLGLASTLSVIGILVIVAKNRLKNRFTSLDKFEKYAGIFSACTVTIFGIILLSY